MTIPDMIKMFSCKKNTITKNINFFIGYTLFRIFLKGSDHIPDVGTVTFNKDTKIITLRLDKKWLDLIDNESYSDALTKYLLEQIINE